MDGQPQLLMLGRISRKLVNGACWLPPPLTILTHYCISKSKLSSFNQALKSSDIFILLFQILTSGVRQNKKKVLLANWLPSILPIHIHGIIIY